MGVRTCSILKNKDDGKQLTQYLAVGSATIILFTTGLYQGWGSPSVVKILSDEYPIDVTEEEASYIMIIGAIGHILAGFLASFLSDYMGRKATITGIAIPQLLSFICIYSSSYSKILLYIARVLGGMGEGASIALIPTYIAEIVEPKARGTLGTFIGVTAIAGGLFINVVGSFLTIHATALVCMLFPILFWITFSIMPESPYYCLMKNDKEGAKEALQMLRRKNVVDKELMQLSEDVQRQMSEKGKFRDLFTIDSNRKAFFIVTAMRLFQSFCGMIAFMSYNQILIAQATDFSPILGASLIQFLNVLVMVCSSWYMDRIGRKPMFVISTGLTFVVLYLEAIYLTIRDYTGIDLSSYSLVPIILLFVFNIVVSGGLGPGVNVFVSEIYSTSIKAKAMSLGGIVYALSVMGTTKTYQYTADNIGIAVPFYIFGTSTAIATLFFAFIVPETKGKSLEKIQQELKGNKPRKSITVRIQ